MRLLQLSDEGGSNPGKRKHFYFSHYINKMFHSNLSPKFSFDRKFNVFLTISLKWEQTSITATVLHLVVTQRKIAYVYFQNYF